MTVAERLRDEAMNHLTEARRAMNKLSACTADWSARALLESQFENVEDTCREFAQCQFGLSLSTPEKTQR